MDLCRVASGVVGSSVTTETQTSLFLVTSTGGVSRPAEGDVISPLVPLNMEDQRVYTELGTSSLCLFSDHNGPGQSPHHCGRCPDLSVDRLLTSSVAYQ